MLFFKQIILTSCILAFQIKAYPSFKPTLNILTTMHILDPSIVAQFETENKANVRVDFVGNREEFETHLKAGLRIYDVVVTDERIMERLYLERLLRSIPMQEAHFPYENYPLSKRSKINEDGSAYLSLFVDPMGIAYLKTHSNLPSSISWDILIHTELNPYWQQRIFISPSFKSQFLLALLATQKEITASSWFIPESTTKWFKQLRLQNANTDLPLELAFLGDKISAAVIFYSDYLRTKKVVPNLDFTVPEKSTYYDRISIGWSANSIQENLSKKFIYFIFLNKDRLAKNNELLPLNTTYFKKSHTADWILYEDDIPLPKRIENILKDLLQSPQNPEL